MEKLLVFLFLGQLCLLIHTSEIPDVNMIFKMPNTSDNGMLIFGDSFQPVNVEIHAMSNSLGKLLLLNNHTIISPISSRVLPPFRCFPSSSCAWKSNDTWTHSPISYQQLKNLSLPLDGFNLRCEFNNGECQYSCQNSNGKSQCSCPDIYYLNSNKKTCSPHTPSTSSCDWALSADSGWINSPGYPHGYSNNLYCRWEILTTRERRISVSIGYIFTELGRDYVTIYDGTANAKRTSGHGKHLYTASVYNTMTITFRTDHSMTYEGISGIYETFLNSELNPEVNPEVISVKELQSEIGVITASLNISHSDLCVSLIYSLPSSGSLNIYAEQSTAGKIYFELIHTNEINGWHISRYLSNSSLDIEDNSTTLYVHFEGNNSKILNIEECSPDGDDIYVLSERLWRDILPENFTLDSGFSANGGPINNHSMLQQSNCSHGGVYDRYIETCVCPIGFAGPTCTEACGPNHFGQNCSGTCSPFQDGCKNMKFCDVYRNCTCAAGFTGKNCERECEPGTYGASCRNLCGKCKGDPCDKYTGECNDLCEEGYYPPLCLHPYAFLSQEPNITEIRWNDVVVSINFTNPKGMGTPAFYQVQYKEIGSYKWNKSSIEEIGSRSIVLANVKNLNVGTKYLLRIVIVSEDGNSYEGDTVPIIQFVTLCQVPNSNDYKMQSSNITSSSFAISWNYPVRSDKWCPINSFSTILQVQGKVYSQELPPTLNYTVYSALLPAREYVLYVCANTEFGKVNCSKPFAVTTQEKVPGKVRHLTVKSRNARNIEISWRRPLFIGSITGYRIHYECIFSLMCEESCRNASGYLETAEHFANLINLFPHVQYKIRVAAYSSSQGPSTSLFATTKTTSPDVSPIASDEPIVSKSNTTVTVQWQPPPCPGRNGQLTGYHFNLVSETENGTKILQTGTTKDLQTSFTSLTPMTQYTVHVHAMNSHGWNTDSKLVILFSSSATVPDSVQDLQVYKKGRRMIGIRWAKPTRIYGALKSYTVSYHQKGTENKFSQNVTPKACSGWPHLYCYTIDKNLQPDKEYIVTVSARNTEVEEDGMASEINAKTRENAPEAPHSLKVSSTSTSLEMEWGLPNMFNGELRSFLVNIEHIDSFNESECCEYFPVQELHVEEESPVYNLEVTGLNPSSTYIVSVFAKTITLGPSINKTLYTSPQPPTNLKSPQVLGVADDGHAYRLKVQPTTAVSPPNSTYLLLVLPPDEVSLPVLWEKELLQKLTQAVNASFYIVSEFASDELVSSQELEIGTGSETTNGTLGQLMDPKFTSGYYRVGLALVQRYRQAISVAVVTSNRLEFGKFDLRGIL